MKKLVWFALCWLGGWLPGLAQQWDLQKEVKTGPVSLVSLDRYGRIYTSDERGNVNVYDSTGAFQLNYSPPRLTRFTLIEAWKTNTIFTFSRDFQQFTLLNRFLAPISQYEIDESQIGFARMATLAGDNNLWVFDEEEFSLKKYDLTRSTLLINVPLNLVLSDREYDLTFAREYQNMLFISDRNSGILVFDNLGNYKKKLPFSGLTYFGLLNDELYFLENNQLRFFHLYTLQERTLPLPTNEKVQVALAAEGRLVLFSGDKMLIYQWTR